MLSEQNMYKIMVVARVIFRHHFQQLDMEYLRTRLERPLVHSMGDSEIFHVQLLKMVTKNDPGNQDTFVLVHKHCGSCICEFYGGVCMFELVCQLKGRRNLYTYIKKRIDYHNGIITTKMEHLGNWRGGFGYFKFCLC